MSNLEPKPRVMLLCSGSWSSQVVASRLNSWFDLCGVIIEESPSSSALLKNRLKKLGWMKVSGQIAFMVFIKLVGLLQKNNLIKLKRELAVDVNSFPCSAPKYHVNSINDSTTKNIIDEVAPNVIVVNGTRIISADILESIDVPVINTHTGITPRYRGVHGGYWALVEGRKEACGVTVHLVDAGIDTGGVLFQQTIDIEPNDFFLSYPIKQLVAALPFLQRSVTEASSGNLTVKQATEHAESKLWYHPGLFEYLLNWLLKGVK